jgi:hypothetical protein
MLRPSDCSAVQLGKGRNGETEWCLTLNLWKSDLKWARCSSRDWNTARQPWQFQDCSSNSSAPTRVGASSATGNDSSLSWSCNPCNPNPKLEGGRGAVAWSRWVKRSAPSKKPGGAVKSVGASDGAMAVTKQRRSAAEAETQRKRSYGTMAKATIGQSNTTKHTVTGSWQVQFAPHCLHSSCTSRPQHKHHKASKPRHHRRGHAPVHPRSLHTEKSCPVCTNSTWVSHWYYPGIIPTVLWISYWWSIATLIHVSFIY